MDQKLINDIFKAGASVRMPPPCSLVLFHFVLSLPRVPPDKLPSPTRKAPLDLRVRPGENQAPGLVVFALLCYNALDTIWKGWRLRGGSPSFEGAVL